MSLQYVVSIKRSKTFIHICWITFARLCSLLTVDLINCKFVLHFKTFVNLKILAALMKCYCIFYFNQNMRKLGRENKLTSSYIIFIWGFFLIFISLVFNIFFIFLSFWLLFLLQFFKVRTIFLFRNNCGLNTWNVFIIR